jgi:4-hydroxy-tetrahydrodipicolinate synthase
VVCATTGECATLGDREWETVVDYALGRVNGKIPVIAGIGKNDTRHTLWLNKRARNLGVQGVLAVTPYYNKTTQTGLLRHYYTVADGADIPMLLYNVPSRTGMSISAETYSALAKHPNICGVKEASGDFGLILKLKFACPEDFALYSGNDDQIVPILAMGGVGVISTMANVIPQETHQICALWKAGETTAAAALQIRCQPLIQALFREVNPIPVKSALAMMGRDRGYLRQPLTEIGVAAREELREAMNLLNLL